MENCALICEYNPFHTGHLYQLQRIRECCKQLVCVMSGDFTQNAQVAAFDKAIRTKSALSVADAVVELPVMYSANGGEFFAKGAVDIIRAIKGTDTLAMGYTCDNPDILCEIARVQCERDDEIKNDMTGDSYAAAYASGTARLFGTRKKEVEIALSEANNVLCVHYIKAIIKSGAAINPFFVKRKGAAHDSKIEDVTVSGTYLRAAILRGDTDTVKRFVPLYADEYLRDFETHAPDMQAFGKIALYALRSASVCSIAALADVSEGLEYRIKKAANSATDMAGFLAAAKTKRYTMSRLRRIALWQTLQMGVVDAPFTRLLGCKKEFDFSVLPPNVATTNAQLKILRTSSPLCSAIYDRAAALYALTTSRQNYAYDCKLIKV